MFPIFKKPCRYARSIGVKILMDFKKKILKIRWVAAEKNGNGNLGDFGSRSGQNSENLDIANSLGNHTVNILHIFGGFCRFWQVVGLSIYLTLSTVFSTVNPIFLHDDLISRKNTIYMKNAEEWARFEIFWRKSWVFMFSLSKSTKTTEKYANYLLCGFLRNWLCPDFSGFYQIWDQNLPDFHFHFFRPSLNGF